MLRPGIRSSFRRGRKASSQVGGERGRKFFELAGVQETKQSHRSSLELAARPANNAKYWVHAKQMILMVARQRRVVRYRRSLSWSFAYTYILGGQLDTTRKIDVNYVFFGNGQYCERGL